MTSQLHLGDSHLDEQHEKLEFLIAALRDAPAAEAVDRLDALASHAADHFATEDVILRVMKDGNAACHIDEHAAVLRSLQEVREVLTGPDAAEGAKAALLQRLGTQLQQWLPEHVQAMDAGVAAHRSKERFGGAPVRLTRPGKP